MKKTILGPELPNIPWEDKPKGCLDVVWRYSGNPILDWNPIPKAARIFNSAVLPYKANSSAFSEPTREAEGPPFFRPQQRCPPMEHWSRSYRLG